MNGLLLLPVAVKVYFANNKNLNCNTTKLSFRFLWMHLLLTIALTSYLPICCIMHTCVVYKHSNDSIHAWISQQSQTHLLSFIIDAYGCFHKQLPELSGIGLLVMFVCICTGWLIFINTWMNIEKLCLFPDYKGFAQPTVYTHLVDSQEQPHTMPTLAWGIWMLSI